MPKGIYTRGVINRKPHSEATRIKMSLKATGKPKSEAHRENIRLAKTGAKYPNRKRYSRGITPINKICLFCKTPFVTNSRQPRKKYCSNSCCTKDHPIVRGWKQSEKQKEIMRSRTGEKHFAWIKDRTLALENHRIRGLKKVKELRDSVFHRDDFTCQDCGIRGGYLEAHHIKPWREAKELRYEINNLITLCRPCHMKTMQREELTFEKYSEIIKSKLTKL